MAKSTLAMGVSVVLDKGGLDNLMTELIVDDYHVIGPQLAEEAIVYDTISSTDDLPQGWIDRQEGGSYRLERSDRPALFDYVVGPHSWKRFLFPARQRLWRVQKSGDDFNILAEQNDISRYAFIGVRSCELQAIHIQDRVFINDEAVDSDYQKRRQRAFIVAVNCARPGNTCFCASMDSGPKVTAGFDLALTEILDAERHEFVTTIGSERGVEMLERLQYRLADQEDIDKAADISEEAAQLMGRTMPAGAEQLLKNHPEHPRWQDVADRCLSCGNCTLVCPTCFCSTVEDTTDLSGEIAERWRRWDSCFNTEFSYLHGGSIRANGRSKYRQWLTHKLAYWHDQFGSSGCVGCGRCITWCPVGIDITAEVKAFQDSDS